MPIMKTTLQRPKQRKKTFGIAPFPVLRFQNARGIPTLDVGWPGRGNGLGFRCWTTSLGPFRSLTDIPSVFSGEVFALLPLATFL